MTKEELEKEAEDKGIKYADSLEYTIPKFSDEEGYCWAQVEQAYEKGALDFAEPREKRIAELEKENKEIKEKLGDVQMQKAGEKSDFVWKLKTANEQKAGKLNEAKDIIERLLANRPDTYSGRAYVESTQDRMFRFIQAVSDADNFLEELEK